MNKLLTTLASVLLISVLAACGNSDNDNANDTIDDSTSNNVEQNDSMDNNDTNNEMADDNNDNNNMEDNNNHKEHEDAVDDNDDATEKMKETIKEQTIMKNKTILSITKIQTKKMKMIITIIITWNITTIIRNTKML